MSTLFRQASDAAFEAMLDSRDRAPPAPTVPCLLVQADPENGGVLGDAAAEQFVARLPKGRRVKVAGASHALHASHPDQVTQAILSFAGYGSSVSSPSR
jgi:pimeloyl-ACP methyl ester carboxylesterase